MPFALPIKRTLHDWPDGGRSSRWGSGLLLALLLHAGLLFWLGYRSTQMQPATAYPSVALMLLPNTQPASTATPEEQPDTIKQRQSSAQEEEPQPEEEPVSKSVIAPNPEIIAAKKVRHKSKPRPQVAKPPEKILPPAPTPPAPVTTAPASQPQQNAGAAGSSAVSAPSLGEVNWVSLLRQRLDHYKRYPAQALRQQAEGVVYLTLTLNRQGQVVSVAVEKSSGVPALDREALALPSRSASLPPPGEEVAPGKDRVTLTLPIRFDLRQ